jgi:DNA-directed RNA polymerase subunit M/transcription elongation factor TFIIS
MRGHEPSGQVIGMHDTLGKRTCPKCGSSDYRFRSRKKVADETGEVVETRYRCVACGHEWMVRQ